MASETFDIVIPLYKVRWNTQAVLEGLTVHYRPRSIHIATPAPEASPLRELAANWQVSPLFIHEEEDFFQPAGLSKDTICAELDLGESLYTPGWFYQQLLKLGAFVGIDDLSEWYMVWDSDLLPVETWPLLDTVETTPQHRFALLQHNGWGNPEIVAKWGTWIRSILGVEPITDAEGTFIPHHMWFKQSHLRTFAAKVKDYYQSDDHWLSLMMRSANDFGTFSEYWSYVSWVAAQAPQDFAFHPYDTYGKTTERFFDDGTGLFSTTLRQRMPQAAAIAEAPFSPSYAAVADFIREEYAGDQLPSSLSFESSPRHLKKNEENMHIEELRSRWNPRSVTPASAQ